MVLRPVRFVLDHNFPWQAVELVWPPSIEVLALTQYDDRLTRGVEDWELLKALDQRHDVHGFITNDRRMLNLETEMAVLTRTRLTLVVTPDVGHQPIVAMGLVMTYLGQIATLVSNAPQVIELSTKAIGPMQTSAWDKFADVAKRLHEPPVAHRDRILARIRKQEEGRSGPR